MLQMSCWRCFEVESLLFTVQGWLSVFLFVCLLFIWILLFSHYFSRCLKTSPGVPLSEVGFSLRICHHERRRSSGEKKEHRLTGQIRRATFFKRKETSVDGKLKRAGAH